MYENRKKNRYGLWILAALLLAALGYGIGVTLRAYKAVQIVERDGRSTPVVYHAVEESGAALSATEIYEMVAPACVSIRTELTSTNVFGQVSTTPITGSGFLTTADGYLFTNYHVIEDALRDKLPFTVTLYDGRSFPGTVIGGDERSDVALVKIEAENLPCCQIGDFSRLEVGEQVYAIGNPMGKLSWTITRGIVSALERTITISDTISVTMFQIDAAINAGNSGGPVVNDRGQVVGIASAKYGSANVEGIGFAIPMDHARQVIDDVLSYGYVRGRAMLGVSVTAATRYGFERGLYVTEVAKGGAAEQAGIRPGDVILSAGGVTVNSIEALRNAKKQWSPGDVVVLELLRDGETKSVSLTLTEEKS